MTKTEIADYAQELLTELTHGDTLCPDAVQELLFARSKVATKYPMKFFIMEILHAAYRQGHHDTIIEAAAKIGPAVI